MKQTCIPFSIALCVLLGIFSSSTFAQSIENAKVEIDFSDNRQIAGFRSDGAVKEAIGGGVTVDSRGKTATLQSGAIEVPLENVEPFLAVGIIMQHAWYEGSFLVSIKSSTDKINWTEWEKIEQMDLIEKEKDIYRSDLLFLDQEVRFVQFKVEMKKSKREFPVIKNVKLSFISPGATPQEIIEKNIEEAGQEPTGSEMHLKNADEVRAYPRPSYVNRKGWKCPQAENVSGRTLTNVTHLVLHHSAGNTTSNDFAAVVRSYWDWHVNNNGWADIGYNWLVDRNGVIYKGRAWKSSSQENVLGAHNSSKNGGTLGICYIGNYVNSTNPTSSMLNSSYKLLAFLCDKFGLKPKGTAYHASIGRTNDIIDGHKDSGGGTTCPGNIANYYSTIRNSVANLLSGSGGDEPANLSTTLAACPGGNVTFNWGNSGSGWQIHVSTSSSFHTYYLKWVSNLTSYTGPEGFVHHSNNSALGKFNEGTKYYWRIKYGSSYTSTYSFTTRTCGGQQITVLDNFESGAGHFDEEPTYSGSTYGIGTNSTLKRTTGTSHGGNASLKAVLYDKSSDNSDWRIRLLSGSGRPSDNVKFNSSGTLSFWLKTSTANRGATVQLWLDDSDGMEGTPRITVNSDGQWHKYNFSLSDFNGSSVYNGNGRLDAPKVTLDAIVLYQPNISGTWTTYFDDLEHSSGRDNSKLKQLEKEQLPVKLEHSEVKIYPTLCNESFTVEIHGSEMDGFNVVIMNTTGVKMYENKSFENLKEIDTRKLPVGVYFVNVRGSGFNKTSTIIIRK